MKEASETEYWLELLQRTDYINKAQDESMLNDCVEIIRILVAITKTAENKH